MQWKLVNFDKGFCVLWRSWSTRYCSRRSKSPRVRSYVRSLDRSIMSLTGDCLKHRITWWVKDHKDLTHSSFFPRRLVIFSKKTKPQLTHTHTRNLSRSSGNIFTATPIYCRLGDYLEERETSLTIRQDFPKRTKLRDLPLQSNSLYALRT